MWNTVFANLRPGYLSTERDLARAEAELGFPLPESYRGFCTACGAGLANGHFRIATPTPYEASDLVVRSALIAHSIGEAVRTLDAASGEPHRFAVEDGDETILERACFFGEGEDGSFLFWDVTGTGEYDVWLLAPDLESVRFAGETLPDVFTMARTAGGALLLGAGAEPLPATFEGIDEAVLARGADLA